MTLLCLISIEVNCFQTNCAKRTILGGLYGSAYEFGKSTLKLDFLGVDVTDIELSTPTGIESSSVISVR